jgi:hypothetical protein
MNPHANDKKILLKGDIISKYKSFNKSNKNKFIAYLYIMSYGKKEYITYLNDFISDLKYNVIPLLNKIIAVYSCIIEEKPLLEEEIGRLICTLLYKHNKKITDLNFNNINDKDHSD